MIIVDVIAVRLNAIRPPYGIQEVDEEGRSRFLGCQSIHKAVTFSTCDVHVFLLQ